MNICMAKTVSFLYEEGQLVHLKVGDPIPLIIRALISINGNQMYRVWDGGEFMAEVSENEIKLDKIKGSYKTTNGVGFKARQDED